MVSTTDTKQLMIRLPGKILTQTEVAKLDYAGHTGIGSGIAFRQDAEGQLVRDLIATIHELRRLLINEKKRKGRVRKRPRAGTGQSSNQALVHQEQVAERSLVIRPGKGR